MYHNSREHLEEKHIGSAVFLRTLKFSAAFSVLHEVGTKLLQTQEIIELTTYPWWTMDECHFFRSQSKLDSILL
jgi:hypothetical protein